jgi:hypothetical protein
MMWLYAMVACEGGRMGGVVLHFVIRLETVWEWAFASDCYPPVLLLMPSLLVTVVIHYSLRGPREG